MSYHAYHLQSLAHKAVARAFITGKLIRKPCELCGDVAQAHHDSYYPDRWLDVRWLCSKHHRLWHSQNQPEWPSIFEFHPSDSLSIRRSRRRPRIWFRKQIGRWYVQIGKTQICLGPDEAEAQKKYQAMCSIETPGRAEIVQRYEGKPSKN